MADEAPKIIVDDDWKSQAKREKEKLAEAERQRAAEKQAKQGAAAGAPGVPRAGAGGGAAGPQPGAEVGDDGPMVADFQSLVGTVVTQALMYMGGFPDPQTGRAVVSLEHAKFHIDLLAVLEEKTKGNLAEGEAKDLQHVIYELRLRFVELTRAVAEMVKEGKLKPGGGGVVGGGPGGAGVAGKIGG